MASVAQSGHRLRARREAQPIKLATATGARRVVIVVPFKPQHRAAVQALVEKGPPFDPELMALERHDVFVTEREAIFLFEGAGQDRTSSTGSSRSPASGAAPSSWRKYLNGKPRIAQPGLRLVARPPRLTAPRLSRNAVAGGPRNAEGSPPMAARPAPAASWSQQQRELEATGAERLDRRRRIMRKLLEVGGLVAGVVLIAFGVGAIALSVNGNSTIKDNLTAQQHRRVAGHDPRGHHRGGHEGRSGRRRRSTSRRRASRTSRSPRAPRRGRSRST